MGENEDRAKEHEANPGAAEVLVASKPRESEQGERVVRKALGLGKGQIVNLNLGSGNGRKPNNEVVFIDGHVGRTEMVPELVLTSEAEEEAIEIDLS